MKKIALVFTALVLFSGLYGAPRFTADFYKADPGTYLNKVVSLKIESAKPSSFKAPKGYVAFNCFTAYQTEMGGLIYVLVPADKAKSFARNYGQVKAKSTVDGASSGNIATKDLKGKFVEVEGEYIIIAQ